METQLITAATLAETLKCSRRHVERLNAAGRLPRPVRLGRAVRWLNSEIEDWLAFGCPNRLEYETLKKGGTL